MPAVVAATSLAGIACGSESGSGNSSGIGGADGGASTGTVTFTQVSAGPEHSCGTKTDGTIACWGDNSHG